MLIVKCGTRKATQALTRKQIDALGSVSLDVDTARRAHTDFECIVHMPRRAVYQHVLKRKSFFLS